MAWKQAAQIIGFLKRCQKVSQKAPWANEIKQGDRHAPRTLPARKADNAHRRERLHMARIG